ncbi:EAL domain-containing protein [Massilia sp. S19_KUP03_FR1]|uniref:EAL domain-containing protein n=1 Tax=Massilia sp. S19_KUP03_FR1 TaxID=3025503 RepID=UPI002FCD7091
MFRIHIRSLISRLSSLYGQSMFGALLLVVVAGLLVPAMVGSYVLVMQERQSAARLLGEALQRNAEVLAFGMQESLWNMNIDGARALVDSVMRDPAVQRVRVLDSSNTAIIDVRAAPLPPAAAAARATARLSHAERDIVFRREWVGRIAIDMDDARIRHDLQVRQSTYLVVLAIQLGVSLLLIVLFLKLRLQTPLRQLEAFSEALARGQFDAPLLLERGDELGRLGRQMDQMRSAIRKLFVDIHRNEEQFRTIVSQVPGAVFRSQPGGPIDFVSDALADITGYSVAHFMRNGTDAWSDLIHPADRRRHRRELRAAITEGQAYALEYRIIDAGGVERWLMENGQPHDLPGSPHYRVDGIITDISERKRSEMRIDALLAEQDAILENVMFGVMFVRDERVVSTNRRCDELFGYASAELEGSSVAIVFATPGEYAEVAARQARRLVLGQDFSEERQYRRSDGALIWCLASGRAVDPAKPSAGSIWVYADITARRVAEEKLRLSATVLDRIADGVMVVDAQRRIVATNPAFTHITGYSEMEALGRDATIVRSDRHDDAFYTALWDELDTSGFWQGELWRIRKDSTHYLEALTVSAVRDGENVITHFVGVFSDITQVKEAKEKLDHMAHHDPLTALPNRLLFHDRLQHALTRAAREGEQLAVMFIDLDRFKNVNDTLGHHVGDALLKKVAQALSRRLRHGDTLARLGGDEFIVLLENVAGEPGAAQVAEKLMTMFEQPFVVAEHELFVTGSVGISLYPDDADDLNMLIRNADVAMYQAKARGRNNFRFYAPSMTGDGVKRLRLEALLRRSIERDEVYLDYQPQVEIDSGRLIGAEALVRWQNAELGEVAPVHFIPLAEETGFINQLGQWVLFEACRQMMRWQARGFVVPKIAVNLSVRQFERGSIAGVVRQILQETGLAPQRLQLEVTESVIMNTGDALILINELHAIGVELAIDDFGTGYSSLAYLKQLPVQTLKIDQSFIKDIASNADDEAIAVAIIQLGKSMNLSVIAEGVENAEQVAFLLRHGCNRAQGYYFSRPVPPDQLQQAWGTVLI